MLAAETGRKALRWARRQRRWRPATAAAADGARSGRGRPAVALRGLRKTYGGVAAVDGVDLEIAAGEFFTMLGPSGSGKTTLLRMIAGFERPDAGTIELGGVDVTRTPPYARNVNTVFQDYALFPHMNVLENVEYGLRVQARRPRRAPAPRAEAALDDGAPRRARRAASRSSSRAGSASASRSRARSSTSRRCCCSTSRSARST